MISGEAAPGDLARFRDIDVDFSKRRATFYYRLCIEVIATGIKTYPPYEDDDFDRRKEEPESYKSPADRIHRELAYRWELMLAHKGRYGWIFPAKHDGPRCSCYDPTLNKIIRENCPECYGTTIKGAFLYPVQVWMQIKPGNQKALDSDYGSADTLTTRCQVPYYPLVRERDMIVDPEGNRYEVQSVQFKERTSRPYKQTLIITRIDEGDSRYRVPLRKDLSGFTAAPKRIYDTVSHALPDSDTNDARGLYDFTT